MRKLLAIALALVLALGLVAMPASAEESYKVAMVTDTGGINDNSFNALAWQGLQRARDELGCEVNYIESVNEADYDTNLEILYDEGYDLIICVGWMMADALKNACELHPEQKYAIIDNGSVAANCTGVNFATEQCSYLVGMVAGLTTKTNNVGFVIGMVSPLMNTFGYGYYAGVKAVNPDCVIQPYNANSYGDAAGGKAAAVSMFVNGADVVYHAAGGTGTGVIEAAADQGKFAIGVDQDQNYLAPDAVITSAVKRVDNGVFNLCKALVEGTLEAGETMYDISTGGVDIAGTTHLIAPEVLAAVEDAKAKMIAGEIVVPATTEQFEAIFGADLYTLDD